MSYTTKILLQIVFTILTFSIFTCLGAQLFAAGEILLAHLMLVWDVLSTIWNLILLRELV